MKCFTYFFDPINPRILHTLKEFFSLVCIVSFIAVIFPSEAQLKQSKYCRKVFLTCLMAVE